jgi:putative FmdB family regulatory protein
MAASAWHLYFLVRRCHHSPLPRLRQTARVDAEPATGAARGGRCPQGFAPLTLRPRASTRRPQLQHALCVASGPHPGRRRGSNSPLASPSAERYTLAPRVISGRGGRADMPIYEYRCNQCRHEFEELSRSMSEERRPPCPQCGGTKVSRKMSVFAAHDIASPSCDLPGGACHRPTCAGGECPMMR